MPVKDLLQFTHTVSAEFTRGASIFHAERRGASHRLPAEGTGRHDTGRTEGDMRHADIASRHQEIFNIPRVKTAERNGIHAGENERRSRAGMPFAEHAFRRMDVDRPAAVCDRIGKIGMIHDIVLRQDVIARQPPRLPFRRNRGDPVDRVVCRAVVAAVLHMIPHAEQN